MNGFEALDIRLQIPDLWQQRALHVLKDGMDLVVHAPTGAGKTYLVELLAQDAGVGRIVHTVPTRALANDKAREWKARGWRVGIVTGDVSIDADAPLVVATLETQKPQFIRGAGPALLVIDEYQMISDKVRGVNYEWAIATAPEETQLLLLSGSVSNPGEVADWLRRNGREVALIEEERRPVPLEQVYLDALSARPPSSVVGYWPRLVAKALMADLGPILIFAPQRKAAERLAKQLAGSLPQENPLSLSPEQKRLAGGNLSRLLSKRVAFHHSGLSYQQRAGLVEPLAKHGQLRIVVATTGLAAGVNFSMRSALITENEYTIDHVQHLIRPDELLQMFGRAGRRGLDETGYALVAPGRPRLSEGRRLPVKRPAILDWPSLISVMQAAVDRDAGPFPAAREACCRLFTPQQTELGVEHSLQYPNMPCRLEIDAARARFAQPEMEEMLNSQGVWEPLPGQCQARAEDAWLVGEKGARPLLSDAEAVRKMGEGGLYRLASGSQARWGKRMKIAFRRRRGDGDSFRLAGWFRRALSGAEGSRPSNRWTVEELEALDDRRLEQAIGYGVVEKRIRSKSAYALIVDVGGEEVSAYLDSSGRALVDPPLRKAYHLECRGCSQHPVCEGQLSRRRSPALAWLQLGLIDGRGGPTRRGQVFSFFQGGEGLAIAAALEDSGYAVEDLAMDLANLRAGFRFDEHSAYSFRLARACRKVYRDLSYEGYLIHGLPPQYGEGAAEVIAEWGQRGGQGRKLISETLKSGDVQRARLEWMSLLRHIARAPQLDWDRWLALQQRAEELLERDERRLQMEDLPALQPSQMGRVPHRLRFPRQR